MKKITLLLLLVSIVSCKDETVADKKTTKVDTHNSKNSIDYVGTYKGILPCADCDGLQTEIAINENSTFCIKTKYQGKGDKVFMQKGNFTWNTKGNIIILKGVNGANQYFVGENSLTQLDVYGKKSDGSFADDYVLSKQPTDTSDIETIQDNNGTTVDLNSRIATTTIIQKVNPAVGKFTLAETKWKLISLNQKKVVQEGKDVYYLKMKSKDGRFVALSGCNNIIGYYAMPSSTTLSFSRITSNKMDCADVAMESQFVIMLAETKSYKIVNHTLTVFGENKKQLAKFEAIR
jgi:copper homeostasis protein (lipoprotein)